ncbi:DUF4376 domain-containing protein [Methylomonas rosea]|uniref:DUF4376 domain-containing protein n=1 Tax=Methylomonas rosea TaxID=2952227 RepID=A0ABT1TMT8_9GAMM|nr:DUF4376 domain-containing protein [Methylomonas sp. WSC-7]MCQ8116090.1 DUF4376 domain-containing protein [Methylomonas sp. WSC-7]
MRAVEVLSNVVVNAVVVDQLPDGYIASETANIGDLYDGGVFVPNSPSAPITRDPLHAAVDGERSRRWRAGFPVQIGSVIKWFHSDEFSLTQHLGLKDKARDMLAAGGAMTDNITIGGQPVQWSTMDGSSVTISVQVAFDLVSAAGLQQALIFAASQAHKAAIDVAEDLSGYNVMAGWPLVFGE